MNFAVVELKYVERGNYVVPIKNIQSSKPKPSAVDPYFCYISSDLTEEPDFNAKYCVKFDGTPGLFRVFIKKLTKTYEEAVSFLKEKRMQTVPKKFRQPSNTDSELKAAAAKKKRAQNKVQMENKKNAGAKNSSHLAKLLSAADSDSLTIASKFEDLVKQTLEESSNSDSEIDSSTENSPPIVKSDSNDYSENARESNSHESQRQPIELSNENALASTSSPNSVSLIGDCHLLGQRKCSNPKPLQQLNQQEQSKASSSNPKNNTIKSYKAAEIQILTLSNEANEMNRMHIKPFVQPRVRKPDTSNAPPHSLSANGINTNKSVAASTMFRKLGSSEVLDTSPLPSLANNSKPKLQSPQETLQLSERSDKQTVDKNAVKILANQMLAGSKEIQGKRKINTGDDVFKLAQKRKIAHTATAVNDTQSQTKIDSPAPVVINVSDVINIDEMIKQKETLANDNVSLKNENMMLKERNDLLQSYLVTASKSAPQVPFEEVDGGRRYRHNANVFIKPDQCKILDTFDDDRSFLNYLLLAVFTAETLRVSSVTGRSSNRTKEPGKPPLDPSKLKFVYDLMAGKINKKNNKEFNRSEVNRVINKKIANLRAVGNPRPRKKRKVAVFDDCKLQEDNCEGDEDCGSFDSNTETLDSARPADPAYNYNESNFITSDLASDSNYLMYDINVLNLVDHSFENTDYYIENAEGQPGQ